MIAVHDQIMEAQPQRFRQYPAYKDSAVAWLGEIPAHWQIKRLKYLATLNDEALTATTDPDFQMAYVDIGSVDAVAGITRTETLVFKKAPSRARRVVRGGDVIISTVRTYLRAIAAIEASESNLIVSTGFAVVRPRHLESAFASYVLRAPHFVERVVANSVGVGYPAIKPGRLALFTIAYPCAEKQRAIAAFLDRETSKIDGLVERKERLIELLQEKRTALIAGAVTRGLDPNAPMKDSGVVWLGEIPTHWDSKALKRQFRVVNGSTPKSGEPDNWNGDIPWVTPDDLGKMSGRVLNEPARYITRKGYASCSTQMVCAGSLILSTRAPIGHLAISGAPVCTNQGCRSLMPRHACSETYFYFQILATRPVLEASGRGSTFRELAKQDLESVVLLAPPQDEQIAIAAFLDSETAKTDMLIAKVRQAIDLLKEFRTALISAAVTGKIDIREVAA